MRAHSENSSNIALIREYFRRVDAASADLLDLFTEDFEFYFPKYGFGYGKDDFISFATIFRQSVSATHDKDRLSFIESGNNVVCEGTTHGQDSEGVSWQGGKTPASRFCSIYEIQDGKIASMRIYVDPDYTSRDTERFLWGMDRRW